MFYSAKLAGAQSIVQSNTVFSMLNLSVVGIKRCNFLNYNKGKLLNIYSNFWYQNVTGNKESMEILSLHESHKINF